MFRTSTLLIVMVLVVGPVASFACDLWCTTPAARAHHEAVGCHETRHNPPEHQQIASTGKCHDAAVGAPPFIPEARQTESAPAVPATLAFFDSSSLGADDEAALSWYVVSLQPPRPASSRAVLRV